MNKKHWLLTFIFFLFGLWFCVSQNQTSKKTPLITVLKSIEKKHKVVFSFADNTIKNVYVTQPNANYNLNETLTRLEKETQLIFEILNTNYIVINKRVSVSSNVNVLDEVLINTYLTSGISKDKLDNITIKPQRFGLLPGLIEPDVLQSIQMLPGILSVDEKVSNINVNGGTHDQNLILWDDIKMYQSGHFFGLISAFNPYLTNKITVTKNGTSAQYGDGISSIINMQQLPLKKTTSGVGVNLINIDGYYSKPISKKFNVQISARRALTDLLNTPTYKQYFKRVFQDTDLTNNARSNKNERFYFYDLSTKLIYEPTKKDQIALNFISIYNTLDYDETTTLNNVINSSKSLLSQHNLALGLTYNKTWNTKWKTTTKIQYSNYNLNATNNDVLNTITLIQKNEVTEYTLKTNTNYKLHNRINFNIGYQFFETGISSFENVNAPQFTSYIKEVIRQHAGYLEANYTSKNYNTKLAVGARLNYIKKFNKWIPEPRFSFSYKLTNGLYLDAQGEFKNQTTTQIIDLQSDFLGIEKRRWALTNNNTIPITKSKQASIGINYKKNNFLASLKTNIKQVKGITTRSQGFQNQYQLVNDTGNYLVKSIDILINKQINNLSSWLSYTFSDNKYTFNTINSGNSFANNFEITHAINLGTTYNYNNFKFALGLNWHTGKPFTTLVEDSPISNNQLNYNTPNNNNLPNYLRVDASAIYKCKLSNTINAEIGASIWNLFNKKNIINRYFVLDNDEVKTIDNISLILTPNLSFRATF